MALCLVATHERLVARALALVLFALLALHAGAAYAVEAIPVKPEDEKLDVTALGELYEGARRPSAA